MVAQFAFWLCIFLLVYSYVLYPILLNILYSFSPKTKPLYSNNSRRVFLLMAAHNEESVILEKLASINASDYPRDKLQVYIGSDNSTDQTNHIIQDYIPSSKYPITFKIMRQRSGKIGTINALFRMIKEKHQIGKNDILIMTDANVMLMDNTISMLSRHFENPEIGVVDSIIKTESSDQKEVTQSESNYLNREFTLKHQEGHVYGKLMGTFGGCFALRADCFKYIPSNFRVDDFYLTMNALSLGYNAISDPEAICSEKLTSTFQEEFKRKRRMSSGNFQNMGVYSKYILPISSLGFVFFSHKVIRYLGPILMIIAFIISALLAIGGHPFMQLLFTGQLVWYIVIPVLDRITAYFDINILALRSVSYFNYMNLALLLGLKDFIYGIESNIWEPTKRK